LFNGLQVIFEYCIPFALNYVNGKRSKQTTNWEYTKKIVTQLNKAISNAKYEQTITYVGFLEGNNILKHGCVFIYAYD